VVKRSRRRRPRSAAVNRKNVITLLLTLTVGIAMLSAFAPSAFASFTRTPLRAITGTGAGPFPPFEGFVGGIAGGVGGGIAVTGADELLVGVDRYPEDAIDRFESASSPTPNGSMIGLALGPEALTTPGSLAVEDTTGNIYLTGKEAFNPEKGYFDEAPHLEAFTASGAFGERTSELIGPHVDVAVDNTTAMPSSTSVYLAHGSENPATKTNAGIEKLTESLQPAQFELATKPSPPFYVKNNDIVGVPQYPASVAENEQPICIAQEFSDTGLGAVVTHIAVDSHGDIFVSAAECNVHVPAVLEYAPSGEFIRAITGEETPGLNGKEDAGWGATPELTGLAVDPVSGNLIVAVIDKDSEEGVLDEFSPGGRFVAQIQSGTLSGHTVRLERPTGLAVDSKGNLYVSDRDRSAVFVYGPGVFLPGVRTTETNSRTRTTVVLTGSVDPEGRPLSSTEGCEFQYVTEAGYTANIEASGGDDSKGFASLASGGTAPCVPSASAIPADDAYHEVYAALSGLVAGVTYRYRLVAKSEGAGSGEVAGTALGFTEPHAPNVVPRSTVVSDLTARYAKLTAEVQPLGAETQYHFEYDTRPYVGEERHGEMTPYAGEPLGSGGPFGDSHDRVASFAQALSPDTNYYARVVAESDVEGGEEVTYGEEVSFKTDEAGAHGLPDGRAYELVTPPDKGGAADMFGSEASIAASDIGYASSSGNQFILETPASFGPFPGSESSEYVFTRCGPPSCADPHWNYVSLADPARGLQAIHHAAFDPEDLSSVAFDDELGSPPSASGRKPVGLVGAAGGPYSEMYEGNVSHEGLVDPEQPQLAGSKDLSTVVVQSKNHSLEPGASGQDPGSTALYLYHGGQGRYLNASESGEPLNLCGAMLGRAAVAGLSGGAHDSVSETGSSVFFTMPDPEMSFEALHSQATRECWNSATNVHSPQVWAWVEAPTPRLIEISRPEPGLASSTLPPAAYVGAAASGDRAFFVSTAVLTHDDEGNSDLELYEWRAQRVVSGAGECTQPEGCLTRISHGESGTARGEVFAVPAISEDGTTVYFTSTARLAASAPITGAEFGSEQLNVYRYNTRTGETGYVTTVLTAEEPAGTHNADWYKLRLGHDFAPEPLGNWYTTPDGKYLLFPTTRELTGYDTAGCSLALPDTESSKDGHCEELYRYAAEPGAGPQLVCVSCDPSGAPPQSHARIDLYAGDENATTGPPRAMSDDGAYVFFNTADGLVPEDSNNVQDVYEWESNGLSGCAAARGCVRLISSGEDSQASYFLATNASGSDVFFGTHARLVPEDADTSGDVYDARICLAAEPCVAPASGEVSQCEGDACQMPPTPVQVQTPATETTTSTGDYGPADQSAHAHLSIPRSAKLKKALKECRLDRVKQRRVKCERSARKRYAKASQVHAAPRKDERA
jgi:hypothetical protein